jgi:hypothetical protein
MNVDLRQLRSFVTVSAAEIPRGATARRVAAGLEPVAAAAWSALGLPAGPHHPQHRADRRRLRLLPTAERLLMDFEAAIRDVKEAAAERRSMLTVACLPSLAVRVLPEAITRFRRSIRTSPSRFAMARRRRCCVPCVRPMPISA